MHFKKNEKFVRMDRRVSYLTIGYFIREDGCISECNELIL